MSREFAGISAEWGATRRSHKAERIHSDAKSSLADVQTSYLQHRRGSEKRKEPAEIGVFYVCEGRTYHEDRVRWKVTLPEALTKKTTLDADELKAAIKAAWRVSSFVCISSSNG